MLINFQRAPTPYAINGNIVDGEARCLVHDPKQGKPFLVHIILGKSEARNVLFQLSAEIQMLKNGNGSIRLEADTSSVIIEFESKGKDPKKQE